MVTLKLLIPASALLLLMACGKEAPAADRSPGKLSKQSPDQPEQLSGPGIPATLSKLEIDKNNAAGQCYGSVTGGMINWKIPLTDSGQAVYKIVVALAPRAKSILPQYTDCMNKNFTQSDFLFCLKNEIKKPEDYEFARGMMLGMGYATLNGPDLTKFNSEVICSLVTNVSAVAPKPANPAPAAKAPEPLFPLHIEEV